MTTRYHQQGWSQDWGVVLRSHGWLLTCNFINHHLLNGHRLISTNTKETFLPQELPRRPLQHLLQSKGLEGLEHSYFGIKTGLKGWCSWKEIWKTFKCRTYFHDKEWKMSFYCPQTKFAKVMFSHLSVILFTGGVGWYPSMDNALK